MGVSYFGVLIIRILLFSLLYYIGSPIFGNSHIFRNLLGPNLRLPHCLRQCVTRRRPWPFTRKCCRSTTESWTMPMYQATVACDSRRPFATRPPLCARTCGTSRASSLSERPSSWSCNPRAPHPMRFLPSRLICGTDPMDCPLPSSVAALPGQELVS